MDGRIVVAGAGSIGCFVGGLLAGAGRDVLLLARQRVAEEIGSHGLHLTSFEGWELKVRAGDLLTSDDPAAALGKAKLVLVTVKSRDTGDMGSLIARHAPADAVVVSLQNGLGNAALLRKVLPGRRVLAGMVPFNVVGLGEGRFHKGTSGTILVEAADEVLPLISTPLLPVEGHADMTSVLAGKLLLNLNNALNALSGLTLHEQLGSRPWRLLLASCQEEALRVFAAHGISPWSMGPLPARALPRVLRLPTFLFRLLSRASVRIDRTARSSMWEDLERRRPTEIGELQERVVAMAAERGMEAPVNRAVAEAVRAAEREGRGSPRLAAKELLRR
jgi:2-dehydropantoate 2-reductase